MTVVAGILHLTLGPGVARFSIYNGIFFIVAGIVQIYWLVPMINRLGRKWYYVGIAGTIILIGMWATTRIPENPITGRGGPVSALAIIIEIAQIAFIALVMTIIGLEGKSRKKVDGSNTKGRMTEKKSYSILTGLVVALSIVGLFVLPVAMGQPNGPPAPGGSNPPFAQQQVIAAVTSQNCTLTPSLIEKENTPQQTEGPYFVDEMLNRSDIRSDPSDGSVQDGIPLVFVIHVFHVDSDGSCTKVKGAHVDIWHANSQGFYSDIQQDGTAGKKYLRGYQVTDDNGTVKFTTIYPGWYQGRAVHVHIKVRTFDGTQTTSEWTSQFYFNDSITDKVQSAVPYSDHGPRDLRNDQDGIYMGPSTDGLIQRVSGSHLLLNLTKEPQGRGYLGIFNVVLNLPKK
jgi:protocatechuate 3,4-dioxygenase beta subunit